MNLALLDAKTVDDVIMTLSIGITMVNVGIKDLVFAYKRGNIERLWRRLGDDDFKAKDAEERKCDNF